VTEVVRIVHLLAAAVWVGGTVALVFVGVPAIRRLEGEARSTAMRALGRRWRPLGWGSMGALVASGLLLADEHGVLTSSALFDTDFGRVVLVKALLVAVLIGGAVLHDFVLGPRVQRELRAEGRSGTRPRLVAVGWANFALTIAVPVLGGVLVSMLQ
jgi:putative copper resistance protein D